MGQEAQGYVLGHAERELQRLVAQAAFYRRLTAALLRDAGLAPGMRVLDLGCGVGDVAFLAAELVGPAGEVVGVDRAAEAVAGARQRAAGLGLRRVRFEQGGLEAAGPGPFDAVVGRLVLMYQPDPLAVLRQAAALLRPGGVLAFQELQIAAAGWSRPALPLFGQCWAWMGEACARAGMRVDMGLELVPLLLQAGLVGAEGQVAGRVGAGPDAPAYAFVAETMRTMAPVMHKLGIVSAERLEVDTLEARLREEAVRAGAVVVPSLLVGAWAVKPG